MDAAVLGVLGYSCDQYHVVLRGGDPVTLGSVSLIFTVIFSHRQSGPRCRLLRRLWGPGHRGAGDGRSYLPDTVCLLSGLRLTRS